MAGELKPNLRAKHVKQLTKTEMCKFFLSNRCGKGSRCPFAHNREELREKPDLNCTSMCRSFLQSGNCDNPNCQFAHCERDLRTTGSFFKSKMCRFASSGRCKHGEACRFAHTLSELSEEAFAMETAAGTDTMSEADAATRLGSGSGDSDHRSGGTISGSRRGENTLNPQVQGARSTTDFGDSPSDQSSSNDGNERRPTTRSNYSVLSEHDQSTRANTTASVMTPNGSGDSGEEEYCVMTPPPLQSRRGDDRARRLDRRNAPTTQRHPGRQCTTVMLTNVPQFLTQGSLLSLLEDLSTCMRGSFDFFFCPWNPYEDCNLGYVIINFFSRAAAAEFELQWSNQLLLPRSHGMKRLRVVPAALQGRAANLRHFSGFDLANHSDPRFRPLVRSGPHEILRPMALAQELRQSGQSDIDHKGNQAPTFFEARQAHKNAPDAQQHFRDQWPTELREQFQYMNPPMQQRTCVAWSEQFVPSGLEATDVQNGNLMQFGDYEDDFGLGSGAETPELENEHPLSRQTSAQAPAALMEVLATLQNQHETEGRGHGDASRRQNTLVQSLANQSPMHPKHFGATCQNPHETQERGLVDASRRQNTLAQGRTHQSPMQLGHSDAALRRPNPFVQDRVTRTPMQQGHVGYGARGFGGDVPSMYDGRAPGDFPYVVLQQGATPNSAWQCHSENGGTGGSNDSMQPYWALVVPPGTEIH